MIQDLWFVKEITGVFQGNKIIAGSGIMDVKMQKLYCLCSEEVANEILKSLKK